MSALRKYGAFVQLGLTRGVIERGELIGRVLFVPMIIAVLHSLWRAVAESGMPSGHSLPDMVWYVVVTEWVALSVPLLYVEIQEDVRRGDIAAQLPRPVSYLGAMYCQGIGLLLVRTTVLGSIGVVCGALWTGSWPDAQALACVLVFGFAAQALTALMFIAMGLAAFWLEEVTPLYWIWQKLLFVLGGLMLPIDLYPRWLVQLGALTPFPSLLAGPAGFMLGHQGMDYAAALALRLAAWTVVTAVVSVWLFSRVTRRLQLNGG